MAIRLSLVLLTAITFFSCNIRNNGDVQHPKSKSDSAKSFEPTTVQLIDSVYNFGKVTDGEKVEYNFRFRNTGTHPLVIESATASCGCTVPEKPEEPVPAGQIGTIKVVFNSKGRVGTAMKEISVVSNAKPEFPVMKITGEVMSKE